MLDMEENGGGGGEGELRGEEEGGGKGAAGGDGEKKEGECERSEEEESSDYASSTLHEKLSIESESFEWKGAKQVLEGARRTNQEMVELDERGEKGKSADLVERSPIEGREEEGAEQGGGGQGDRRAEDCSGTGNRGVNPY